MDSVEIKALVEKDFDGETTLEEESLLESYFMGPEIDPSLLQFRPMFGYFREERAIQAENGFEDRLFAKIAAKGKPGSRIRYMGNAAWLSAAATVLILLGGWWFYLQSGRTRPDTSRPSGTTVQLSEQDTYKDPRQAMAAVEKAMLAVSGNMNRGEQITRENLSRLNTLNKVIE